MQTKLCCISLQYIRYLFMQNARKRHSQHLTVDPSRDCRNVSLTSREYNEDDTTLLTTCRRGLCTRPDQLPKQSVTPPSPLGQQTSLAKNSSLKRQRNEMKNNHCSSHPADAARASCRDRRHWVASQQPAPGGTLQARRNASVRCQLRALKRWRPCSATGLDAFGRYSKVVRHVVVVHRLRGLQSSHGQLPRPGPAAAQSRPVMRRSDSAPTRPWHDRSCHEAQASRAPACRSSRRAGGRGRALAGGLAAGACCSCMCGLRTKRPAPPRVAPAATAAPTADRLRPACHNGRSAAIVVWQHGWRGRTAGLAAWLAWPLMSCQDAWAAHAASA